MTAVSTFVIGQREGVGRPLGDPFRGAALSPRMILECEADTVADPGMVIEPEFDEGAGARVAEIDFTEDLKGLGGGLAGMGSEAVGDLEAILVGLMLDMAAEGVGERSDGDHQEGDKKEEHGKGSPVIEREDGPGGTPAPEEAGGEMAGEPEDQEGKSGGKEHAFGDVIENVVSHFVAEDEGGLRSGEVSDGRIVDDDTLGSAKAGDVGIEVVGFGAGDHEEHALGRDAEAGAVDDAFEGGDELWMSGLERLEFVEEGVNDERLEENEESHEGKRSEPEIEPPAARAAAEDSVKDIDEKDSG